MSNRLGKLEMHRYILVATAAAKGDPTYISPPLSGADEWATYNKIRAEITEAQKKTKNVIYELPLEFE